MSPEADDPLYQLPTTAKTACKDCGSEAWTGSNPHPCGGFYQCNNCHVYDEDSKRLLRIQ